MNTLSSIWQSVFLGAGRESITREEEIDRQNKDERLREAFDNQYWLRMIAVDDNVGQPRERFALVQDIIYAYDAIDDHDEHTSLEHQVHFDPRQFNHDNPDPRIEEFELDLEVLKNYGLKCSRYREQF